MEAERTSFGFHYVAIRRPIANSHTHDYLRKTVYIAPFTALIPPNDTYNVATLLAPRDDVSTAFYFIAWNESDKKGIDQEAWRKFNTSRPGIDLDANWWPVRTRENNYQQDRNAMKLGDSTGISGIPNQDIAMWVTMGPIADRTRERVGASDRAIVEFRQLMVDAARQMQAGGPALGITEPRVPHASIASYEGVVPKGTDWRALRPGAGILASNTERVA
jgi:phthalate 4,5-dioxygenase oxygenase subunit